MLASLFARRKELAVHSRQLRARLHHENARRRGARAVRDILEGWMLNSPRAAEGLR